MSITTYGIVKQYETRVIWVRIDFDESTVNLYYNEPTVFTKP